MAKDVSYPVFDQMEDWANELVTEQKSGTFDDTSESWKDAPAVVDQLAEAVSLDVGKSIYASGRKMVAAVLDSAIADYTKLHGTAPSGALIHNAVRTALNGTSSSALSAAGVAAVYDDVSATQSDAPLVTSRAAVAVYQNIIDGIPFAGYIEMMQNMSGRIIVANHLAGSTTGGYRENESLDGINGGKTFMSHERVIDMNTSDNTAFTATVVYADGDSSGSPIIPSSTQILVNGLPAGGSAINASVKEAVSGISGSITLNDGKTYAFTGTTTNETGEVSVTFTPALPVGATVTVVALLNFEHKALNNKRPVITADARGYDLRATFASSVFQATQEALAQWHSEVRLDLGSEAMLTMTQQHNFEKHSAALKSMYRVGKNFVTTVDTNSATRQDYRSRRDLWSDILFSLTAADQAMIERTNAYGIGVIYVGSKGKAELSALPPDIFQPSGLPSRTGIYRIGRLFGAYDVYYAPNIVKETATSLEMLCIGRSQQTGLNPYILGDVVSPTFKKLQVDVDLKEGAAYFYAGAARINPYINAAQGAAIIAVTGL